MTTRQLNNPNRTFAKVVAIPFVVLMGLMIMVGGGGHSGPSDETPEAKTAAEAADVGDIVNIRYPSLTIMCEDRADASKVYIVGETMLRQTYRIENSASKAFEAARAGQKHAMASAYSCEWAPTKDVRFIVQEKSIVGDKDSLYHVAAYCLKPETGGKCSWIEETATMNPQIKRVPTAAKTTSNSGEKK